ncbi:shikimate dehydrogenase family protein [Ancylomarina longa]|uniref:Shikimate dehydrogenase n=1 Tax=Ancylomarina longa TaxID=2487017 RepID=A0A434B023_9BACT|nr:shikimate dehydrogenase [Ancylomarina longa]RUT80146.1 shikimate dehydrogenase [Ancylomarina longa]
MNTYGIIGYPLTHSFSKKYFTDKFKKLQLDAQFLNFEIPSVNDFVKIIKIEKNLKGLCITIPYKEKVIPFLDEIDPLAKKIGAVNSIQIRHDGNQIKLKGYNTDIFGFMESLKDFIGDKRPKALILGTGGASKAIAAGLAELGIAYRFVSRVGKNDILTYDMLNAELISTHQLIVNCTPLGTFPKEETCPDIPYHLLGSDHYLYDLVYNPAATLFLKKGAEQDAKTHNGLNMLHLQAEKNWEIWHKE